MIRRLGLTWALEKGKIGRAVHEGLVLFSLDVDELSLGEADIAQRTISVVARELSFGEVEQEQVVRGREAEARYEHHNGLNLFC